MSDVQRTALGPMSSTVGQVEISRLGRVAMSAVLVGACCMLWAWSRMNLRETALSLDVVETEYARAYAENQRLLLERATLRDPTRVRELAPAMGLRTDVDVVRVGRVP